MPALRSHLISVLAAPLVAALLLLPSAGPATAATHPGSDPAEITPVGSLVFFAATTAAHGRELWVTNGTKAGTREVADINAAAGVGSGPEQLTALGAKVFFFADDGTGQALWKSDGTAAGTMRLGGAVGDETRLTRVGGRLFFSAASSENPSDSTLWTSTGTAGGTVAIANVPYIAGSVGAGLGGHYYFFAYNGDATWSLWRSDGTPASTSNVAQIPAPSPDYEDDYRPTRVVTSGNHLYFLMETSDMAAAFYRSADLWQSDGTSAGTRKVRDFASGNWTDWVSQGLTDLGGTLYFGAQDDSGLALWKTDGTYAGTGIVKRISPDVVMAVGSRVLFFADDGTGMALWRSRGTARSTAKVYQIALPEFCAWWTHGPYCQLDRTPVAVGSRLFFPAGKSGYGIELWTSDGTAAGTHMVKNIGYRAVGSLPSDLAAAGTRLFFSAKDTVHGRELWVSDGSVRGTHMVMDINPG